MPKNKRMTDSEIAAVVESAIGKGVGFYDSKLSKEREEIQKYYDGTLPGLSQKGKSKYVSMDLFDSVESLKANLMDAFTGSNKRVSFKPVGPEDIEDAEIATVYTEHVIFEQNDGEEIYHDIQHNGLTSRTGVAKVWWESAEESSEEEFSDLSEAELYALLADEAVEVEDLEQDPATGMFSGTILRTIDKSQAMIEVLPPEEFGITENAKSLKDADACWHITRRSLSDLRKEGYPAKLIDEIKVSESTLANVHQEIVARFDQVDGVGLSEEQYQDAVTKVDVYEVYINLDIEDEGITQLWKVTQAGTTILDKEQVTRRPFICFSPLRRPHSFWGTNWSEKVMPTQNAKTVLTRGILDHTVITNNPRYEVLNGTLTNVQELMDNRFGGIVNVKKPGGINPIIQAPLNPYVFNTIQLLDERKEDTTGVSKLSKGLSKDAVSHQNAAGMIEDLVTLSQQRQKLIAKNFARFVKELYLMVYELVLENEDRQQIIEVAGNFAEVSPATWRERRDMTIDVALVRGEEEKQANDLLQIDGYLSQAAGPLYGVQNKYHALRRALKRRGIKDADAFLTKPEELQPPQPDPMLMKEMEIKEREMALKERQQMLAEAKAQHEQQIDMVQVENKLAEARRKAQVDAEKAAMAQREQQHKEEIDWAEVAELRKAEEVRGIASPDS